MSQVKNMEIKERNRIIRVISFFTGLFLIGFTIVVFMIPYNDLVYIFTDPGGYFILDLLFLIFTMFFYVYFKERPVKTLKGKKTFALVAMVFGGILVVLPLIGTSLFLYKHSFLEFYLDGLLLLYLIPLVPLLLLIIVGVILLIYGLHLRKNLRIENTS